MYHVNNYFPDHLHLLRVSYGVVPVELLKKIARDFVSQIFNMGHCGDFYKGVRYGKRATKKHLKLIANANDKGSFSAACVTILEYLGWTEDLVNKFNDESVYIEDQEILERLIETCASVVKRGEEYAVPAQALLEFLQSRRQNAG